ncbi:MAG: hypothetical protein JWP89_4508 [Schlesneria sp.]|nr:hypothetical protein [Schlesneria sp.]
MPTKGTAELVPEGNALILFLFEEATSRLLEREIVLTYEAPVVEWLIEQSDWRESLNPIRTLDGFWHEKVAKVIEEMLLNGRLHQQQSLAVALEKSPSGKILQYTVTDLSN